MTDVPFLTAAWAFSYHYTLTWTHSGSDIFGWYIQLWETDNPTHFLVSNQYYNTALREFLVPQNIMGAEDLQDDTDYTAQVTALSLSGHVASRKAYFSTGHTVSHTFFDGTEYTWAKHDLPIDGSHHFLCEQEISHIGDFTLPSDFLPATAIPTALNTAIRYRVIAHTDGEGWDAKRQPSIHLFGRPVGHTPDWSVGVKFSSITVNGGHASGEWNSLIGPPDGWVGDTYNNDFIDDEITWRQASAGLDPDTGTYPDQTAWTRANLLAYKWGFAWWASVNDDTSDLIPVYGVYSRTIINEGRINKFKVFVNYVYPPWYEGDPPPDPPPDPEPDPDIPNLPGIFVVPGVGIAAPPTGPPRHDTYYGLVTKKIPNPTIKTALFGE